MMMSWEAAIMAGAEDVQSDEDGHVIYCQFDDFGDVTKNLEEALVKRKVLNRSGNLKTTRPLTKTRAERF